MELAYILIRRVGREGGRREVATIVISRCSPWHLSRNGYACRTMAVANKSPSNK